MGSTFLKLCGTILAVASLSAHAFQITSLSPQGEVARVRQVLVKFDDSAVAFGDPKAEAPLSLSCSDAQVTKGSGRWVTDPHLGPALGKVVDCLAAASHQKVIVVGHSMGGLIARYAAANPDRSSSISSIARTLGAPDSVPAGKVAFSTSRFDNCGCNEPSTFETMCCTCEYFSMTI